MISRINSIAVLQFPLDSKKPSCAGKLGGSGLQNTEEVDVALIKILDFYAVSLSRMATENAVVDYLSLSRRELQILCKKHGIPANKTNAYMADALASLLKGCQGNGFVSTTPRDSAEDDGIRSIPSNNICSSSSPETELEGTEVKEEDTAPAVKDTYVKKLVEVTAKVGKQMHEDANDTTKDQLLLQQVELPVGTDGEDLCEEKVCAIGNVEEEMEICIEAGERNSEEAKRLTGSNERPVHMKDVECMAQVEKLPVNAFICSESVSSEGKEINTKHHEEADMDEDLTYKTADSKNDKRVVSLPTIFTGDKSLSVQTSSLNKDTMMVNIRAEITGCALHETVKEHCNVETGNKNCMDTGDTKGLVKETFPAAVDEAVHDGGLLSQIPLCSRDETSPQTVAQSNAGHSDASPGSSFQFFVECDNGIKLFVDLKNNSPLDWMKNRNYEFSLPQDFHEHKLNEQTQVKSTKCPSISKEDTIMTDKNIDSLKRDNSQPQFLDFERSANPSATNCSSNFPQTQKISAGSCLPDSSKQTSLVASTSPWISAKNSEAPTDRRRTPSVLIPPHGANRGLSPLMSHCTSKFSSPFTCHGANIFSAPSSVGTCWRPQAYDNPQVNCSSKNHQTVTPSSIKSREDFAVQSTVPEKELAFVTSQFDGKITHVHNKTIMSNAAVSSVAAVIPAKDDLRDVEMLDQELYGVSAKSSNNDIGLHSQEEVVCKNENEVKRISQVCYPQKSKKEMHDTSPMKDFQDEEPRMLSRFKDGYKKSPFIKNLRSMKSLARASNARADILSRKRAISIVENVSSCVQSPSLIKSVHSPSQTAEEKQNAQVSSLRESNENAHSVIVSPKVYRERDLCVSGTRRSDREISVISPRVCRERDLCVSGLSSVKDSLQNVRHISLSSTQEGAGITRSDSMGFATKEDTLKRSTRPFPTIARKRFIERALAESTKRMQAQKMQQLDVNDGFPAQKDGAEKVLRNSVLGCQNHNGKTAPFLQELNLTNSSIIECEHELYGGRVTERQKRHQEQFKTPLIGKSREKAMKIAKQIALVKRNEILTSKRGITSTN
eukprot:Gb_01451 [translate_table: standard]